MRFPEQSYRKKIMQTGYIPVNINGNILIFMLTLTSFVVHLQNPIYILRHLHPTEGVGTEQGQKIVFNAFDTGDYTDLITVFRVAEKVTRAIK